MYKGILYKTQFKNKKDNISLINYWIIDKECPIHYNEQDSITLYIDGYAYPIITNGLIGPMDSLSFIKFIKKNNIPLTLN